MGADPRAFKIDLVEAYARSLIDARDRRFWRDAVAVGDRRKFKASGLGFTIVEESEYGAKVKIKFDGRTGEVSDSIPWADIEKDSVPEK